MNFSRRTTYVTLLLASLLGFTGCKTLERLPTITADSFDYKETDPAGGTIIHAEGVKTDPATHQVSATKFQQSTIYPMFSVTITATGFKQNAPATPPKN